MPSIVLHFQNHATGFRDSIPSALVQFPQAMVGLIVLGFRHSTHLVQSHFQVDSSPVLPIPHHPTRMLRGSMLGMFWRYHDQASHR